MSRVVTVLSCALALLGISFSVFTSAASAELVAEPAWVAEDSFSFDALSNAASLDTGQVSAQVAAAKVAHDDAISTPAAIAEREDSIDAFTDLGTAAAIELITEVFAEPLEALTALPTDPLLTSESAPEFNRGSDTSARIDPVGPEDSELVVSDIPLRNSDDQIVSGQLQPSADGFDPKAPLANVEIPDRADESVSLSDVGIEFEFGGATGSTGSLIDAATGSGKEMVLYPNTQTDTDTAVTYTLTGVETFNYLRSAESPENFELNYTLPSGAALQETTDGGAVALDSEGETLLTIFPPYAVDAQGSFVPMDLSVDGSTVNLAVDHRGGDFAYPIMVDPVQHVRDWWANGATPGYEGWGFHEEGTTNYNNSLTCPPSIVSIDPCGTGTGAGLYVSMVPTNNYPAGSKGYWRWKVPGGASSSIKSASVNAWRYRKGGGTYGFAFYNLQNAGGVQFTDAGGGTTFPLSGADSGVKYMHVGLSTANAFTMPSGAANWRYARLANYSANLTDGEAPSLTLDNPLTTWVGPSVPFSVTANSTDPGLGLGWIEAKVGGTWVNKWAGWCTGTYPYTCPTSQVTQSMAFNSNDFPSGINSVPVRARDIVDGTNHETEKTFTARIDRTNPVISTVGGLTKPTQAGYQMTLQVTDNTLAGPTYDASGEITSSVPQSSYGNLQSGAKRVRVYVDGVLDAEQSRNCQGSLGSCKIGAINYTMPAANYSEGTHVVKVEATDMVGNTTTSTWNKLVDRTAPVVPTITRNPSTGLVTNDQLGLTVATTDFGYGVGKIVAKVGPLTKTYDFDCASGCSTNGSHAFSFDVSTLPESNPPISVTVSDQAGNSRTTDAGTFTIDRDAPEIYDLETTRWANDSFDLDVEAANLGAGINQLRLERNDTHAVLGSKSMTCTSGCPAYVDEVVSADVSGLTVGAHALDLKVSPPTGTDSTKVINLNIDRSTPDVDQINGALINGTTTTPVGLSSVVHVEGSDSGSGIHRIEVAVDDELVATELIGDLESDAGEQICAAGECTFEFDVPVSLPLEAVTGVRDIEVAVVDAAGNRSVSDNEVLLDATAPAITLGGDLASRHGQYVDQNETLGLTIGADDGSSNDEAGVETVSVSVDGDPVALGGTGPDCSNGCPSTWSTGTPFQYDASQYGSGPHTILVEASDAVGNVDSTEIQINPEPSTMPDVEPECPTGSPDPITNNNGGSVAGAISTLSPTVPSVVDPTVPYTVDGVGEVEPHLEGDANDDTLEIAETPLGGSVSTDPAGDMILNHGMCFSQSAVSDSNSEVALVGDHSVVVADSTPNADTFVRPNELGLTIVTQVRNANGASALSWDIGVAQDQTLQETPTGGVALVTEGDPMPPTATDVSRPTMNEVLAGVNEVVDQQEPAAYELTKASASVDGKLAAVLSEPRAIDANGNEIPVDLSINGTSKVSIAVPSNAAYPVTVIMSGFTAPDPASFCLEVNRDDPGKYWSECHDPVAEPTIQEFVDATEMVDTIDAMLEDDADDEPGVRAALQALRNEYRADATASVIANPLFGYEPQWAEISFCVNPVKTWTCKVFYGDSQQASNWAGDNFTNYTGSNRPDATWGNAFQHSLWVALMSKSANTKDALEFAMAHESYYKGSTDRRIRQRTIMDIWNNRKGANYYLRWGTDNNEHGVCSILYHQSAYAEHIGYHNARRYGTKTRLKYIWVRGIGGHGKNVLRRSSNKC